VDDKVCRTVNWKKKLGLADVPGLLRDPVDTRGPHLLRGARRYALIIVWIKPQIRIYMHKELD
jgi:hypothetical protein